jgi:prepilin signal peptidase PulO-like enzyme (type II secretory pathway)
MIEILILVYLFILGACLGSFASALLYRIPRGQPWAWTRGLDGRCAPARSMCPPCGRVLSARELIPIVSWAMQRGRCACGKTKVSWIYPALEVGFGLLFFVVYIMLTTN